LKDAETFICVGANFGWYPLVSSSLNPNVKIFGFECNSAVRSHFERNVAYNEYHISIIAFAISDQENKVDLFLPKAGNDGMSTLYPMHGLSREVEFVEKVDSTTLDIYFGSNFSDFGKTVILMDIEGSEMRALLGGIQFFTELKPVFICEINSGMLEASGYNYLELFAKLSSAGYKAFWIDERGALIEVKEPMELPHTLILPSGTGANYLFRRY
jgi:FkbM family methyltransferase